MNDLFDMLDTMVKNGDACVSHNDKNIDVTLIDFEGFDEDWGEIWRDDYTDPTLVDMFREYLINNCNYTDGNYYKNYYFDDYVVIVGYTSFDI